MYEIDVSLPMSGHRDQAQARLRQVEAMLDRLVTLPPEEIRPKLVIESVTPYEAADWLPGLTVMGFTIRPVMAIRVANEGIVMVIRRKVLAWEVDVTVLRSNYPQEPDDADVVQVFLGDFSGAVFKFYQSIFDQYIRSALDATDPQEGV